MSVESAAGHQATSTNVGSGLPSTNENRSLAKLRTYPVRDTILSVDASQIESPVPADTSTLIVDNGPD